MILYHTIVDQKKLKFQLLTAVLLLEILVSECGPIKKFL